MGPGALRLAGAAGLLILALVASAGGGPDETAAGALELRLELRSASGRTIEEVAGGEPIDLVLEIRNGGATPLALEFATARTHDFAVQDPEGREVWRWSHGRLFAQALTSLELAAGETRRFAATWDQRDASGHLVGAGRYRVIATLACVPAPPPAGPVELEID